MFLEALAYYPVAMEDRNYRYSGERKPLKEAGGRVCLLLASILLAGCAEYTYDVQMVKIADGKPASSISVAGTISTSNHTLKVTLPSGENLEGQYATIDSSSVMVGSSLFTATNAKGVGTGMGTGVSTGGSGNGYSILKGDKGTIMEISFSFNPRNGNGFGTAITNTGDEYRVLFIRKTPEGSNNLPRGRQ